MTRKRSHGGKQLKSAALPASRQGSARFPVAAAAAAAAAATATTAGLSAVVVAGAGAELGVMISGAEAEAEEHVEEQESAAAEAPVAARKGCNQRKGGQLGALSQLETNLSEGMMTSDPRAEAERSRLLEI